MAKQTYKRAQAGVEPGKAEWVRQELIRGIRDGTYPVGSQLPSVIKIGKLYKVSPTTAFVVVRDLAKEELVACNHGRRGTVVLRRETKQSAFSRKTLVCLLRPHGRNSRNLFDNFGLDILQGLRDEISARHFRFIYHALDESDYEQRMSNLADDGMVTGMILDQFTPDEIAGRLASPSMPVVIFNREVDLENVSAVVPDYERVGRESLRFLLDRGYRRLGFYPKPEGTILTSVRSEPTRCIHRAFLDAARAQGLREDRILQPSAVPFDDPASTSPERFGLPRRKPKTWTRLGVLAGFDVRANQLMEAVAQTDLVVGRDIGIIGCGDLDCNTRRERPFSTWRIDTIEMGRETVRELIRRIDNPARPRAIVKLPAEFLDRNSA